MGYNKRSQGKRVSEFCFNYERVDADEEIFYLRVSCTSDGRRSNGAGRRYI